MRKLMKALMLADLVQVALDAQDVFRGGVAAAAAEQVIVEQVNRGARGLGAACWLQRTIPIRDFKSHRDYGIHAAS